MRSQSHRRSWISRREFLRGATQSTLAAAGVALAVASKTPAQTRAAVVARKQDVIMGIGTDVKIMDTRITMGGQGTSQIFHVIEPLMWPDNTGKPAGILTSAWEPIVDLPGWRFKLRPNIKFTNGEPFNAQAVKYSIESLLDDTNKSWVDPQARTYVNTVKEVKVEDDLTAVFVTTAFTRTLPINLMERNIVPPKYGADQGKNLGLNPIGTGHYELAEYRAHEHLMLKANPQYHGRWDGPTKNATLTFRYLPENATRVAALEAGEVHLIDNLPPDSVDRVKRNPNLKVLSVPSARLNGMFFHCGRAPFNNVKARLAVAHAIDRDAIVKKIMGGMTQVATVPFSPGTFGTVGETFRPFQFDPQKAKQYFREAGLTNGTKIKVGGSVGRYINDKQVVAAVASMVADVGFDPQIEQLEFGSLYPKIVDGYYDLFYIGWATRGYDPVDFKPVYTGFSADNSGMTHFVEQNKQVLQLYDSANKTPSQQEAERYCKELAHLIWDNVPVVQLFYEPNIAGVSKTLRGWTPRRDTYIYVWSAYLE